MKRSVLKDAITDFKAAVANLEDYYNKTKKQHRKLNDGNGTYDPIEYWTGFMYIHLGILRGNMNLRKSREGSDGKGKQYLELPDGSKMCCYWED